MKRTNTKKLALDRETLAALNPDVLADIVGGAILTTAITRAGCPSQTRIVCPPKTLVVCTSVTACNNNNAKE